MTTLYIFENYDDFVLHSPLLFSYLKEKFSRFSLVGGMVFRPQTFQFAFGAS